MQSAAGFRPGIENWSIYDPVCESGGPLDGMVYRKGGPYPGLPGICGGSPGDLLGVFWGSPGGLLGSPGVFPGISWLAIL